MSEPVARAQEVVVGEAGADDQVVVEVGSPAFYPGRTRVELSANGRIFVSSRLHDTEESFESSLDPDGTVRLLDGFTAESGEESVEGLLRSPFGQLIHKALARLLHDRSREPVGAPVPDEPRYHIEVFLGSYERREMDLWRREIRRHPELARALAELSDRVQDMSEGRATL